MVHYKGRHGTLRSRGSGVVARANDWKLSRYCREGLGLATLILLAGCAAQTGEEPVAADTSPLYMTGAAWPSGTVRVCWSASSFSHPNFSTYAPVVRQRANEEWPTAARISIVGWLRCPTDTRGMTVIDLNQSNAGNATVGYFPNGTATASFGTNRSDFALGVVPQGMGFVLGFHREHQRPDWRPGTLCGQTDDGTNIAGGVKLTVPDDNSIMNFCSGSSTLSSLDRAGAVAAYGARVNRFATSSTWTSWSTSYSHSFADVNGDGRADIIGRSSSGDVQVALSTGSGFSASKTWSTWDTRYNLLLADVNADGRADLVGRFGTDVQVALSTGTKFASSSTWTNWSAAYDMQLADVDGDGRADIVGRSGTDVQAGLSTGTRFNTSTRWTTWVSGFRAAFVDVTGDGRADIIGNSDSSNAIRVGVSTGAGFLLSSQWTTWDPAFILTVGDVNGDGRADLVGRSGDNVQVGISRGESGKFAPSTRWTSWAPSYDLKLADTNGDGRVDIVGRSGSTVEVGLASN